MAVRFELDHAGMAALLIHDDMADAMRTVALGAATFARSISPDATPHGEGYVNGFRVSTSVETSPGGTPRQTATLANVVDHAAAVEWGRWYVRDGTAHFVEGHHVLGRTLAALRGK